MECHIHKKWTNSIKVCATFAEIKQAPISTTHEMCHELLLHFTADELIVGDERESQVLRFLIAKLETDKPPIRYMGVANLEESPAARCQLFVNHIHRVPEAIVS